MSALNIVLTLILFFTSLLLYPVSAYAGYSPDVPYFPKCPNPGGTQTAYYAQGWHWIVGQPVLKWGADSVHYIGNDNYVQCYCPLNQNNVWSTNLSQGIQTNWLKAGNVSQSQKTQLLSLGWILVQNGADFGLKSEQYLAKNSGFFCSGPTCLKKITQTNNTTITNIIKTTSNSGDNQTSANTGTAASIETGSAYTKVIIKNILNTNSLSN